MIAGLCRETIRNCPIAISQVTVLHTIKGVLVSCVSVGVADSVGLTLMTVEVSLMVLRGVVEMFGQQRTQRSLVSGEVVSHACLCVLVNAGCLTECIRAVTVPRPVFGRVRNSLLASYSVYKFGVTVE